VFVPRTSSTTVATWFWQTEDRSAECVIWGSDRASSSCWSFNLLREEFLSAPIHSPPLSGRLIGPSFVDLKSVLSLLPRDTGHIRWTPCEDVSVVPEEAGEREFLFGVEVGPDDDFRSPRQTFLTAGLGSKAVVVLFYFGTCRVVWSILAA
jgi:hypothetical protein